jgi:hypothetical protein
VSRKEEMIHRKGAKYAKKEQTKKGKHLFFQQKERLLCDLGALAVNFLQLECDELER